MAFSIAVASGKGGTGKTTVALNLFFRISRDYTPEVVFVDCDVEEPNAALFFPESLKGTPHVVNQEIPVISTENCTFCRKCAEYCEFNAILVIPPIGFAEVNPDLCHSCGACLVACKHEAISVRDEPIGQLNHYHTETGRGIEEGILRIGSAMQTMVIRSLKKSLPPNMDILLFDAPPGTSCPVVETISGSDYLILVTEPTPFGLHDLKLMISLTKKLGIPYGVVINKANLGTRDLYDYLQEQKIEILCEIPFDASYASQYARAELFKEVPLQVEEAFNELAEKIIKLAPAS
jgi:MinD superfamily P-loop ATPase